MWQGARSILHPGGEESLNVYHRWWGAGTTQVPTNNMYLTHCKIFVMTACRFYAVHSLLILYFACAWPGWEQRGVCVLHLLVKSYCRNHTYMAEVCWRMNNIQIIDSTNELQGMNTPARLDQRMNVHYLWIAHNCWGSKGTKMPLQVVHIFKHLDIAV